MKRLKPSPPPRNGVTRSRQTLAPSEGIAVKLVMEEGQVARFAWTANGGVVNYDTHADGGGQGPQL